MQIRYFKTTHIIFQLLCIKQNTNDHRKASSNCCPLLQSKMRQTTTAIKILCYVTSKQPGAMYFHNTVSKVSDTSQMTTLSELQNLSLILLKTLYSSSTKSLAKQQSAVPPTKNTQKSVMLECIVNADSIAGTVCPNRIKEYP